MQGKTTFILTDKDTGRVVEKREEHNMVTNAIRDIFTEPRVAFFNDGSICKNLANYLPMYNYLLHGLVLFGDSVPEKSGDYLIDGRYNIIGTAGSAYTGTDAKRGTFNTSQSGVIENGYRFVWDFAPEKAIGNIKCASLSSIHSGNQGGAFSTGTILANGLDISNSNSNRSFAVIGSTNGYYSMNFGSDYYYYSWGNNSSGNTVTIYKYKMPNPNALEICSTRDAVLEKSFVISTGYYIRGLFSNVNDGKLYWFGRTNSNNKMTVKIGAIDVRTEEHTILTETPMTTEVAGSYYNNSYCAFFENQLYIALSSKVYVYNLDGTLAREIPLSTSSVSGFFLKDGKIGVLGKYSSTGTFCFAMLGSSVTYFPTVFDGYFPVEHDMVNDPYCAVRYNNYLYIMLRTDYMATINNLTEPLEKTDQHALQVRYEITN